LQIQATCSNSRWLCVAFRRSTPISRLFLPDFDCFLCVWYDQESEEAGDSLARDTVAGTSTGIVSDVAAPVFSAPPVVIAPEAASFPEPIANHSSVPVTVRVPASLSVSPCSVSSVAVSTSMSSSTVTELSLPACPCSSPSVCTCIHRISTPTVTIACSGREFVSPEPRRARVHWRRVDLLVESRDHRCCCL
jgi:hypothetical protein